MKSKIMGVSVALIMVLILATTVSADTARGKIGSDTIRSVGSFVFASDEFNWVTLSIKVRKLVPYEYYQVGWVQYKNGAYDTLIYDTVQVDSRGNINFIVPNTSPYDPSFTWSFKAFVDSDFGAEPLDFYGPEVGLNFQ
jgi:hypothetical protein